MFKIILFINNGEKREKNKTEGDFIYDKERVEKVKLILDKKFIKSIIYISEKV